MKIQVYGSGCDKCKKLAANIETAAKHLGVKIELEKVTDITAITDAGILVTPALAIGGKVVSSGKVLSPAELEKLLNDKPCSCDGACQTSVPEEPKAEDTPCCCCGGAKKGKKYLTAFLLLFILAIWAFMCLREAKGKTEISAAANQTVNLESEFSRSGTPLDNAVDESFFACMKREELSHNRYDSQEQLEDDVNEYIDFFNKMRPHRTLNNKTPNQMEEAYFSR